MKNLRVAIVGFGNIGQNVLKVAQASSDVEVIGIVSRDPDRVLLSVPLYGTLTSVYGLDDESWVGEADVAILCGGSKADLPSQGPFYASRICTVDSFDTHSHVGEYLNEKTGLPELGYFAEMDLIASATGHTALVCQGWDPGLFSLMRGLFQASLGEGVRAYAFYGLTPKGGLSMGHSDAIRQIPGVVDARQYTHAIPEAIERVRSGENPAFKDGDMHWRECFVVVEDGADQDAIEKAIVEMPGYFAPFKTTVDFVSLETLRTQHVAMPHDGLVVANNGNGLMEFKVSWQSNPLGTAGILLSCARACLSMNKAGQYGAFSPLSVPAELLLLESVNALKLV